MPPVDQHLLAKLRLQGRTLVDDAGRVAVDAPCRGCGYNLRGIPAEGTCPECGHAVADALRDDRPEYSDPRWLRAVVLGGNLFVIAGGSGVILGGLLVLGSIIAGVSTSPNLVALFEDYLVFGLLLAGGLTWLLAAVSCWLVTARDPARIGQRWETAWRWTARVGLILCVPALGLTVLLVPNFYRFMGLSHRLALFVLFTLPVVLFGVGLVALLLCLRTLTIRMAEWEVARMYKTVCIGLAVTLLVYLFANAWLALGGRDPAIISLFCCGCDFLVAAGLILWACLLTDQTRRALNAAYQRTKWAEEDA